MDRPAAASPRVAPPARRVLALADRADVARTLRQPSTWFWGAPVVVLGTALGLCPPRAERASRRMSFWLGVCGCRFAASTVVAALSYWAVRGGPAGTDGQALAGRLALGLGLVLAAALAAKLAALGVSRGLFALELLRLLAIAPTTSPKGQT